MFPLVKGPYRICNLSFLEIYNGCRMVPKKHSLPSGGRAGLSNHLILVQAKCMCHPSDTEFIIILL